MNPQSVDLPQDVRTPAQIAAYWMLREQGGGLSPADREQMNAWLAADSRNSAAYDSARAAWQVSGLVSADDEVREMRAAALAAGSRQSFIPRAAAASLAALALVAAAWLVLGHPGFTTPKDRYETAIGERLAATLPDGSSVSLDTNSCIDVQFEAAERRVHLRQGQALFEVAKNPARPFVVYAAGRRIRALGTSFDVRVDPAGTVRVLLLEGRVTVENMELRPGEQFTSAPAVAAVVKPANVERLVSWRSGRLIFEDEPLGDAVAELNRYTRTRLVIDDPRVAALRVSAVFRTAQAERFASSMTELFPLVAIEQPDGAVRLALR